MITIMFEDLEPIFDGVTRREVVFNPDQTVFHQGDPVQQVFFVTDGRIDLVRHQASGAILVLHRAGPGAMLAEASLYSAKYHCDATAVIKARAWIISKRELLNRLSQNSELGLVFIKRLAHELQYARFHAEVLSLKTVSARLDAWIEWNGAMPPKGEWAILAAELGVSPEALYREMASRRP